MIANRTTIRQSSNTVIDAFKGNCADFNDDHAVKSALIT